MNQEKTKPEDQDPTHNAAKADPPEDPQGGGKAGGELGGDQNQILEALKQRNNPS